MTDEQKDRLREFKAQHGYTWKAKLRSMWLRGADANEPRGHLLRQVRNTIGPSGLDTINLEDE